MIILTVPEERYLKSYTQAYDVYAALGISTYGMTDPRSCDIFEKYENYRLERNLKPDRVGSDYYWLVDEDQDYFIGEITIRHRLNDLLNQRGGHIGYVIRSNEWGRAYGTLMLKLALEKAKARGLYKVLITCNDENLASARVMEKNGCVLENIINVEGQTVRRYWRQL